MTLKVFVLKTGLLSETEIEKVRLLAYFFSRTKGLHQVTTGNVGEWFSELGLSSPNFSRLNGKLKKSKKFIRGNQPHTFRLHATELAVLDAAYPELLEKSEEVVSSDEILPESLFTKTRSFIEQLGRQINASYEYNIFDGCAVLMRRLVEVLLILSYRSNGIESRIEGSDGGYKSLSRIVGDATTNRTLDLSKDTKDCIDDFRTLGNFSAHKIYYNAKRPDIKKAIPGFRVAIEELLYKSGIKT